MAGRGVQVGDAGKPLSVLLIQAAVPPPGRTAALSQAR